MAADLPPRHRGAGEAGGAIGTLRQAGAIEETARVSYHVSAVLAGVPSPDGASAAALARLLDDPNTRQILHVTYGPVLHGGTAGGAAQLGDDVRAAIWTEREAYWSNLAAHIGRHLRPFATAKGRRAAKGVLR
jgi:hypothetical protein